MAHLQRHNKKKVDDVVEVGADGSLAPPPESGRRRRARGARRKAEAEEEEEAAPAEPAAEEAVDETGLNPDDISFVMEQTQCTRAAAVKALRENDNDMINAVMALGK